MKKTITLSIAAIIAVGTMSFDISSGSGNKTGRTTTGCGGCHGSTATTSVSLSLAFNPSVSNGYVAGTVYTVTATVANSGELNAGIDLAATAGTLAGGSNTQVYGTTGEITHTGTGNTTTSGSVDFNFTWTAPASGSVTFNYVGLAGNSSGSSGDFWNLGTQTIVQNTTGIAENVASNINFFVFPSPVKESATVSYFLSENSVVSANLVNVTGQVVSTFFSNEQQNAGKQVKKLTIDPSLTTGIYFLSINVNGKQNFKKIVVE